MDRLEFLRLVLPEPGDGVFCFAAYDARYKRHEFAYDLNDLLSLVDGWVERRYDVYMAMAQFAPEVLAMEVDRRTAVNARKMKALFIDMDGYESPRVAAQVLGAFLQQVGLDALGKPTLVSSGGGLHAYWPFTESVDIVSWKSVAENLKRLCKQEGLKIDEAVTADAARVLRLPGTMNFKPKYPQPLPVVLRQLGDTFDFAALSALILGKLKTPGYEADNVLVLPGMRPSGAGKTPTQLLQFKNQERYFRDLVNLTAQGEGCQQLAHFIDHAHEQEMEPQWRAWLSIAKECTDSVKAINKITSLHPSWHDRLAAKLLEIKGPYGCPKFDSVNTGGCTGCKHKGKIANPLALITRTKTTTEPKFIEDVVVKEPTFVTDQNTHIRPQVQYPFSFGENGGVYVEAKDPTDPKSKPYTQLVLPYDLYITGVLVQQGEYLLRLKAQHPLGVRDMVMPVRATASKDETVKFLSAHGVTATTVNTQKWLHAFVCSHATDIMQEMRAQPVPDHLGWQPDGSFVLGTKVYRPSMVPMNIPVPGLENATKSMVGKGTLEGWCTIMYMLTARGAYDILGVMLASAASALMEFTNFYGITIHCGSSESGTGKSLALAAAASVWGDPAEYRVGKGTSHVAMQHRLGLLRSMPLVTDELTVKSREGEVGLGGEWVCQQLLDMTEGKGKERMEASSNRERNNTSMWRTMAIMSSNTHWTDLLTSRKHSTEGEMRRLLEFKMDKEMEFSETELDILQRLSDNFGVVGQLTAQYLVDHRNELRARLAQDFKFIKQKFNATDSERFWINALACIRCMGNIWAEAGIIALPLGEILLAYYNSVQGMREALGDGKRTAKDILSAYIADHYGNMLVVKKDVHHGKVVMFGNDSTDMSLTRTKVHGRLEMEDGHTSVIIPMAAMKNFCTATSFSFASLKAQLAKEFPVEVNKRIDLGKGTKVGAPLDTRCLVVRLPSGDVGEVVPAAVGES